MSLPFHTDAVNDGDPPQLTLRDRVRAIRRLIDSGEAARLGTGPTALYVTLALRWANESGYAWPAEQTIADALGADRRSIRRWRRELVHAGHLIEVRRGGAMRPSIYQLRTQVSSVSGAPVTPTEDTHVLGVGSLAPPYQSADQHQHQQAAAAALLEADGIGEPTRSQLAARLPDLTRPAIDRAYRLARLGSHAGAGLRVRALREHGAAAIVHVAEQQAVEQRDAQQRAAEAEQRRAELAEQERRGELVWSQLTDEQRDELHQAVLAELPAAHPAHQRSEPGRLLRPRLIELAIERGMVADAS